MTKIFVSYRRTDNPYAATWIRDRLANRFGPESIYFDIDSVPLGTDFQRHIEQAVDECDVLLVVIGREWLEPDSLGNRRLDDPLDFVRIEVERALERDIPVIPVPVDGARMPSAADLPESISGLARRNAAEVRSGTGAQGDIARLIKGIEALEAAGQRSSDTAGTSSVSRDATSSSRNDPNLAVWLFLVLAVVGVAFAIGVSVERRTPTTDPERPAAATPMPSDRPAEIAGTSERFQWSLASGGKSPMMVSVPGGTFEMGCVSGSSECYDDQKPAHTVSVRPFALSKTELTFADYERFAAVTKRKLADDMDAGWGRGAQPAINVSWNDAAAYAQWLSDQTGQTCRLPSEAEWEYAARAGSASEYWWGDRPDREGEVMMNTSDSRSRWSDSQTAPVGQFQANPFGLHDMHGNVLEWVQDCWHDSYEEAPDNGASWGGENEGDCGRRVVRGGSWFYYSRGARSADRIWSHPEDRNYDLGFRVLCSSPILDTDH